MIVSVHLIVLTKLGSFFFRFTVNHSMASFKIVVYNAFIRQHFSGQVHQGRSQDFFEGTQESPMKTDQVEDITT